MSASPAATASAAATRHGDRRVALTSSAASALALSKTGATGVENNRVAADSVRSLSDVLKEDSSKDSKDSKDKDIQNASLSLDVLAQAIRIGADVRADAHSAINAEFGQKMQNVVKGDEERACTENIKKFTKLLNKAQSAQKKHEQGKAKEKGVSVAKMTELEASARSTQSAADEFAVSTLDTISRADNATGLEVMRSTIAVYDALFAAFLDGQQQITELLENSGEIRGQATEAARLFAQKHRLVSNISEGEAAATPELPSGSDDGESSTDASDSGSENDNSNSDDDNEGRKSGRKGATHALHPILPETKRKGASLIKRARALRDGRAAAEESESESIDSSSESSSSEDEQQRQVSARQLMSQELGAQRERKAEILEALIGSEKLYVKELKKLVDSYADSIRKLALDSDSTKITTSDVALLFGNSAKLSAVHQRFRFAIDESLDTFRRGEAASPAASSASAAKARQTVGGVLLGFLTEMQPQYLAYVRNYASAIPHIEKLRKESKAFASVLKAIERPQEQATLANSLSLPLHRIRTYGQFAQRLLDATPTSHAADYAALEEACDKFAALDASLSEQSSSVAGLAQVDAIGSRMIDLPLSLSGGSLQLPGEEESAERPQGLKYDSTRRLVCEGHVKLVLPQESTSDAAASGADRAKFKTMTVVLFSDVIILLAPNRGVVSGMLRFRGKEAELLRYHQHMFACDMILIDGDAADQDVPLAARYVPHTIVIRRNIPENQKSTTGALPGLGNFGGSFFGGASPTSPRPAATKTPAQLAAEKSQHMLEGDEPAEVILCFETAEEQRRWLISLRETAKDAHRGRTFNVELDLLMQAERNRLRTVPWFITKIIEAIKEGRKLETEGLFRLSGSKNTIHALRRSIQMGSARGSHFRSADVHTCTGLFKLFFREMPDPVFTYALYDEWIACVVDNWGDGADVAAGKKAIANAARSILTKLPLFNQFLLQDLFSLLNATAARSEHNKMQPSNLAIVMSTNVLYRKNQGAFDTSDYKTIYTLLESMMEHFEFVFEEVAQRRQEYADAQVAAAADEAERERTEREEARQARRSGKAAAEIEAAEIIKAADEREAAEKRQAKEEKERRKLERQRELEAQAEAEAAAQLAAAEAKRAEKARIKAAKAAAKQAENDRREQEAAARAAEAAAEKQRRREEAERQFDALLAKEKADMAAAAAARQQAASSNPAPAAGTDEPTCAGCSKPINDGGLVAVDKKWHRDCFVCTKCRGPLGGKFIRGKDDGMPYCSTCFAAKSGAGDCPGCGKPISGQFMRAMNGTWHPECFVCASCRGPLSGGFFDKGGKPHCKNCVS